MSLSRDDSIVIDDLVRTAEASRLRRCGALRLDHHHHYPHPPAIISFDDDEDDDYDDHDEEYIPGLHHIRRQPAPEYKYSLFCGGDVPSPTDSTPFKPSILPLAPPAGPPLPPPPKQRTTNGCGAPVHAAAAPRRRPSSAAHTWYAPPGAGASATLVPLDPAYIDDPAPLRLHCAPCGCVREALACAVCGNLLGTRFAPCPIDTHSYARAFPSAADTCAYSYSFLPAAVSSSPAYSHSSSPPTPAPAPPARAALSTPPPLGVPAAMKRWVSRGWLLEIAGHQITCSSSFLVLSRYSYLRKSVTRLLIGFSRVRPLRHPIKIV
ncbi:hypothetical protein C0992_003207 [Termitomyces sp. T32_za158]|nr:hypothetical protein C0992_003207 [Termitomyces sp. T32_za158]